MGKLKPPQGFDSWLDYAVATLDTRTLWVEAAFGSGYWPEDTEREDFREAAEQELKELRARIRSMQEVAAEMFAEGILSMSQGARVAGTEIWGFLDLLKSVGVPAVDYPPEELDGEDLPKKGN